jgi:hypothetical protein
MRRQIALAIFVISFALGACAGQPPNSVEAPASLGLIVFPTEAPTARPTEAPTARPTEQSTQPAAAWSACNSDPALPDFRSVRPGHEFVRWPVKAGCPGGFQLPLGSSITCLRTANGWLVQVIPGPSVSPNVDTAPTTDPPVQSKIWWTTVVWLKGPSGLVVDVQPWWYTTYVWAENPYTLLTGWHALGTWRDTAGDVVNDGLPLIRQGGSYTEAPVYIDHLLYWEPTNHNPVGAASIRLEVKVDLFLGVCETA